MAKKYFFVVILLMIFLAACKGEQKQISLQNPFIGGTDGVVIDFQNLRKDVYDGGRDPFDITVRVENKGEAFVSKNNLRVRLSGFNPAEFSTLEEKLARNVESDLSAAERTPQGNIIKGAVDFVEFKDLNHFSPIVGASTERTVRANVCYTYKTQAVSKLCVRVNLLNPETGGICEINANKDVFSSSAPLQVSNLVEFTRKRDAIGFSFDVKKAGSGLVFEKNSNCDTSLRAKADKVFVKVNTGLAGLTCSGLSGSGSSVEGFVTLFEGGVRTIECTQVVTSKIDFENLVNIDAVYDYDDYKEAKIMVKHSGEQVNSS